MSYLLEENMHVCVTEIHIFYIYSTLASGLASEGHSSSQGRRLRVTDSRLEWMQAYNGEEPQPAAVIPQAERVQWGQRQLIVFFYLLNFIYLKKNNNNNSKQNKKQTRKQETHYLQPNTSLSWDFLSPQTNLRVFLSIWGNLEEI